jgi:hypothetical protein
MSSYLATLTRLSHGIPALEAQSAEIRAITDCIAAKQVLAKAPQPLGLLPDQREELEQRYGKKRVDQADNLLNNFRSYLSRRFGLWSLPNLTTAQLIKKYYHAGRVLEVMAGNAYWSKALQEAGCQVLATDSLEWAKTSETGAHNFVSVQKMTAAEALAQYGEAVDLIICAWAPNFNESDCQLVTAWRRLAKRPPLIFVGERDGATNSPRFWQSVPLQSNLGLRQINASFTSFDFIDEKIFKVKD